MSYRISLDEIDGCLNVTDGEHMVEVERFATDGIREVYGRTVELLDRENAKLREDLEFERSENGWVREFLNRMGQKCGTKDCPSLVAYVNKLEAENAKLRELVRDYERCTMHADCSRCEYDAKLSEHCPLSPCFPDTDELRELRIEVAE